MIVFLHAFIVVIQLLAFSATVKLIRITRQWSWLAIGAGLVLAGVRTVQPIYYYFEGTGPLPSMTRTLISLAITSLLFVSLHYAIPKFRSMLEQADQSRENERRLRTLMGNLPGIAYRCRNDRNWTMEFISDGCLDLTGYDAEQLLNHTHSFAELIHEDDREHVWQEVQAAVEAKRKFQLSYRIRTARGEERWVWEQGCGVYVNRNDKKPEAIEGFITDITEQKRAELELLESETRFRQITENLRDVFWLTDWAERKVVYVSPAYKDVWGADCQSLYDKPKSWRDVLHPEDRERVIEAFEQASSEKPFDIEYRIVRGMGETRWIHDRAIPIMGNDGSIYRMAGFSEDITARKEAEVRVRENELRLRLMVEQMPAILWTIDNDLRMTSSMGAGLNGLGLKPNELVGQTLYEFFGTDDVDFMSIAMHRRALAGECVTYDINWADRSYNVVLEPRRSPDGQIEGAIGAALDVTDQVNVTKLLSESELRFQGAFVHAPIGIALVGTNGRFLKVNHRLCEMVGYNEAELIDLSFQQITHVEDLPSGMEALIEFMQGNREVFRTEKRYIHKDGREVWIDLSVSPVRGTDGQVQYFVSQMQNVTDRKNAERELKASEQRFRSAFDDAPIGEALIDHGNRFLKVNRRLCEMLGYEERELLEKSFDSFAHPEDVEKCRLIFESFRAGEVRYVEVKKRYLHRDGSIVWTEVTGSAVCADDGLPIYFVVQIKDISKQVAAEEAKREIDELFRGSFENAPIGITINSADGTIARANPRVCEMLGYTASELKELTFQQITHRDDLPIDLVAYDEFMRDERDHFFFEKRYLHKHGHSVWIQLSVSAVRDEKRAVQYFVTQIQDITERKRAENDLRESEEKYRTLTEAAKDSIFMIDENDRVAFVNDFGAEQFRTIPERLVGRKRADLFPRDIAERMEKNLRHIFDTGEIIDADEPVKFPTGDRWLHTRLAPLHDEHGKVRAVLGISRDITERKQTEDLRQQRDLAEASNRAKNAFLANVSHEIRTPLMSILGAAEILLAHKKSIDGRAEYVDMIARNGRHLLALVNDLLDLASIEAGKLEVYPFECSLIELLADVRAVVGPLHTRPGLELAFEYLSPMPARIHTDPIRLKQAIINLVSNALKYTDMGHVHVSIGVAEENGTQVARFAVADTGIGIKDDDIERVFHVFARADLRVSQVKGGAGLGLPLTEWIARALGGRLEVWSEWGKGSEFTLVVPLGDVERQEWTKLDRIVIPAKGTSVGLVPHARGATCGSILLAEDDPDVRLLVTDALTEAGAEVVAVENGRDAVDMAAKRNFDLILLDVRMPIMTGLEAVLEMRNRGIVTPIIAMTASTAQAEFDRLVRSGFDDLWPKPITMEQLVESALIYLPEALQASEPKSSPVTQVLGSRDSGRMLLVIEEFKKTLPSRLKRIEDAVSTCNPSETREALHQLVGTAGMMGIPELSSEAARLLRMIRADGAVVAPSDLAQLRNIVSRLTETTV